MKNSVIITELKKIESLISALYKAENDHEELRRLLDIHANSSFPYAIENAIEKLNN